MLISHQCQICRVNKLHFICCIKIFHCRMFVNYVLNYMLCSLIMESFPCRVRIMILIISCSLIMLTIILMLYFIKLCLQLLLCYVCCILLKLYIYIYIYRALLLYFHVRCNSNFIVYNFLEL